MKEATRRKWRDVERKLPVFFRDEYIEDVTVQAGKDFRVYLQSIVGLSENSIRRQIGITSQWPKTFQNCRSTGETELFKLTGGSVKAVCSWIGNSPAVVMQHYAQVTESDMKEAAKFSVMDDAKKAVHNPVQNTSESSRIESHESRIPLVVTPYQCETNHQKATACDSMQNIGKWALQDLNL